MFQVAPGLVLRLFESEKFDDDLFRDRSTTGVCGVMLSHSVSNRDEVLRTISEMHAAGVTILKPLRKARSGSLLRPRDRPQWRHLGNCGQLRLEHRYGRNGGMRLKTRPRFARDNSDGTFTRICRSRFPNAYPTKRRNFGTSANCRRMCVGSGPSNSSQTPR